MTNKTLSLIALLLSIFSTAHTAAAQTPEPLPPIIEPPPRWNFDGLTIDYQRVDVTIEDQIATTHIDQLFVNDNDWLLEGTYLFPLPEGAAVTELTMWVDGKPIEAKILRKEEARAIYDEIVRQLRDPALLEYVGNDAIQANVFPIPPHEERRIEIEYKHLVPADGGLIHYVYPQSTKLYTNLPLDEQSIRVEIRSNEAIRSLYSPTHRIAESRDGDFRAVVGYEAFDVIADTDFELYYGVSPEEIGLNLLSYKEGGQDGFFMLLAAPSVEVDENQLVAKDVILVLDTSGSMEGEKMAQAQEAAAFIIDSLNSVDRFNIVSFSTGVRTYSPALVPVGDAGNYQQYINSLEALGGTNISQALLQAAAQADSQRPTTIIFLTDGLATEGIVETEELIAAVERETPRNVRIFAFGVGDDVDTLLLDGITSGHRGTTSYVRPFERIDEELSSFFTKINTPVLADIEIDYGGITVEQLYPADLPDLFAGTQLVLVGRYREGGPTTITLSGDVNGEQQTFTYSDIRFRDAGGDDFIPRLWATRAIGNMLTEIRLKGERPELIESIVNLSIRYGIITPYTSYLIEEDDIFSQLGREQIVEEEMASLAATPPAANSSGEAAVDEADAAAEMMEAAAPVIEVTRVVTELGSEGVTSSGSSEAGQPVQFVGSKTFVLRDGRWIDTAYDTAQAVEQLGFASNSYFDLLSAAPELGQYFALGERVLVVYAGIAYEVVPDGGESSVTLPSTSTAVPEVTPTVQINPANPTLVPATTVPQPINTTSPNNLPNSNGILYIALGGLIALIVGLALGRLK